MNSEMPLDTLEDQRIQILLCREIILREAQALSPLPADASEGYLEMRRAIIEYLKTENLYDLVVASTRLERE